MYSEIDSVTRRVEQVMEKTERAIEPVRHSLLRRFPISITLLITFGVAATFYGAERLINEIDWLNERPLLIFLLGVSTLAFTGKLYQKLG